MNHQEYKKMLAEDVSYQKIRKQNKHKLALVISAMLIKARQIKGMTQEQLAKALGTRQSSIARLENGYSLPSLSFLKRIADVYETDLVPPRFSFLESATNDTQKVNMEMSYEGGVWLDLNSQKVPFSWNADSRKTISV